MFTKTLIKTSLLLFVISLPYPVFADGMGITEDLKTKGSSSVVTPTQEKSPMKNNETGNVKGEKIEIETEIEKEEVSEIVEKIIKRAKQDLTEKPTGKNCKIWAQAVIKDASKGKINLPRTYPDAFGWQLYELPNDGVERINSDNNEELIYLAKKGDIIQMNLAPGQPHTAIILNIDKEAGFLELIESNWYPPYQLTASSRIVKITSFTKRLSKYSIYRITEY